MRNSKPSVRQMRHVAEKKIPTPAAATKVSFHEPLANVALAHSPKSSGRLASSVGALACLVVVKVSSSLSGEERHRRVKSDGKLQNVGYMDEQNVGSPETHSTMSVCIYTSFSKVLISSRRDLPASILRPAK